MVMNTLWSKAGQRAWRYLEQERGLTEEIIVNAGLGYIPGHHREWKTIHGLTVPCGITIPWYADGMIWGIKVRRAAGEQRYQQVKGSRLKGCLYQVDRIRPGLPVLITEGEFDALVAQQVGAGTIIATAIGSTTNTQLNPIWLPKLSTAPVILICLDSDHAGAKATEALSIISSAVRCIVVPHGKDISEFALYVGQTRTFTWLQSNLGDSEGQKIQH